MKLLIRQIYHTTHDSQRMAKSPGRPPTYNEKPLPEGLRGEFCATMRKLANKHGVEEVAKRLAELEVSNSFVYHVLRGVSMPEVNDWPSWASALGLKSWRSFFKS